MLFGNPWTRWQQYYFVTSLNKMSAMLFCHAPGSYGNTVILLIPGQDVSRFTLSHPWMIWLQCYFMASLDDIAVLSLLGQYWRNAIQRILW